MSREDVPANYRKMDLSEAKRFDRKVRENFMPAIISTVRQIVEDYGPLRGTCVDVGCGTAIFAIELCKRTSLKIYALDREEPILEVARINIEKEGLSDRIVPVLGDAHDMPFEDEFADFVISRGSYHCWEDRPKVLREIYRVLKRGGVAFVGGGFGRYVTDEELNRMKNLRDRSLGDAAEAYRLPGEMEEALRRAGIPSFRMVPDRAGFWAEIKKL